MNRGLPTCQCPTPEVAPPKDDARWCRRCRLLLGKSTSNSGTISPDLQEFGRWQIKELEKGILQSRRMIHEIRQRLGIQE